MNKNDLLGMLCYMCTAFLLGADIATVCLVVKENADRVAYYGGKWNKGDLVRGGVGIVVGWTLSIFPCLLLKS